MINAIQRLVSLKVSDVMSQDVVVVRANQAMSEIADVLTSRGISGVPVVDNNGCCVGVLSAVDFVKREQAREASDPSASDRDDSVAAYMSSTVLTIPPDSTLMAAVRIMGARHIHRLPVLDEYGKPQGLLTSMDMIAALINAVDEMEQVTGAAASADPG